MEENRFVLWFLLLIIGGCFASEVLERYDVADEEIHELRVENLRLAVNLVKCQARLHAIDIPRRVADTDSLFAKYFDECPPPPTKEHPHEP